MAESTTISASQQRVIDYLEKLASEGKTVPTVSYTHLTLPTTSRV